MELHRTLEYDATPDEVFAMLCDQAWREEVCRRQQALEHEVTVTQQGTAVVVTTRRVFAPDLPSAARRFVGDRVTVAQTETWAPADSDGARTAQLVLDVVGAPAGMRGTTSLRSADAGSVQDIRGEVKINVPFIGGRFEPDLAKVFVAAIKVEHQAGRDRLAG